ncbi:hypothetical protein R2A130_0618 [Ahrensia sp. R2A130]|nr:hypothetical protein R2A130_0618 [Ahrensia sp. R2A130]
MGSVGWFLRGDQGSSPSRTFCPMCWTVLAREKPFRQAQMIESGESLIQMVSARRKA